MSRLVAHSAMPHLWVTIRMVVIVGLCVWTALNVPTMLWAACIIGLLSLALLVARFQADPPSPRWNQLDGWFHFLLALPMPLLTTGWRSPWMLDSLLMFALMVRRDQRRYVWLTWLVFASGLYLRTPFTGDSVWLWTLLVLIVPVLLTFNHATPASTIQSEPSPPIAPQVRAIQRRFETIKHYLRSERESYEGTPVMDALEQAQHGLRETHQLLYELDPQPDDVSSVIERIRTITQQWQDCTAIPVTLELNVPFRFSVPIVDQVLIRAVQETLSNVLRHAKASKVEVELRGDDDQLVLIVRDNGVGLANKSINREGFHGLRALRYRVQEVNGSLDIYEGVDGGLVVQVAIPVGVYAL